MTNKISYDELLQAAAGQWTGDLRRRFRDQLAAPDSRVNRLLDKLEKVGEDPFAIDWWGLVEIDEGDVVSDVGVNGAEAEGRRVSQKSQASWGKRVAVAVTIAALSLLIITFASRPSQPEIQDGQHLLVLKDGTWTGLEGFGQEERENANRLLNERRFDVSERVARLTRSIREIGIRSGDDPYTALVEPINTAIETDRPIFKWRPPREGATSYEVLIFNADGNEIAKETVTKTEWQVEEPLQRGEVFSWKIVAISDGERRPAPALGIPRPSFEVLDRASVERVRARERELAGSHLLLSVMYAESGLLDKAQHELKLLLEANEQAELIDDLSKGIDRQRRGGM